MDRIAELERKLENMMRLGTVEEVSGKRCRVRSGKLLTDWLPWFTQRAGNDSDWWPPEPGEQVMILSPGGDLANGYVLPAIYSNNHPAPSETPGKRLVKFGDGASGEYDKTSHTLTITVPNGKVIVSSPEIDLGNSGLEPSVLGDKMAAAMAELILKINNSQVIGNLGAPTSPISAVTPVEVPNLVAEGNVYSQKNRNQ